MAEQITEDDVLVEWTTAVEALDIYSIQELIDLRPNLLWTPLKNSNHLESDFAHFIQRLEKFKLLGSSIRPVYALHHILFDYGLPGDEWNNERIELLDFILKNTKGDELNRCVWGAEKNTTMHLAYLINQPDLTQLLLENGASEAIPNKLGNLPVKNVQSSSSDSDEEFEATKKPDSAPTETSTPNPLEPQLIITKKEKPKDKTAVNTSDRFRRLRELAESPNNVKKSTTERQNSTRRYFRPGHIEERKRQVLSEEEEIEKQRLLRQRDIALLAQRSAVKNNPLLKKFEEQKDQEQAPKVNPIRSAASIMRDRRKKEMNPAEQVKRSSRVINSLKENSYVTGSIFRQQAQNSNESFATGRKFTVAAPEAPAEEPVKKEFRKNFPGPSKKPEEPESKPAEPEISPEPEKNTEPEKKDVLPEIKPVEAVVVEKKMEVASPEMKERGFDRRQSEDSVASSKQSVKDLTLQSNKSLDELSVESLGVKINSSTEPKIIQKKEPVVPVSKVKEIINVHEHLIVEEDVEIYSTGKVFSVWKKNETNPDATQTESTEAHSFSSNKDNMDSNSSQSLRSENESINDQPQINKPKLSENVETLVSSNNKRQIEEENQRSVFEANKMQFNMMSEETNEEWVSRSNAHWSGPNITDKKDDTSSLSSSLNDENSFTDIKSYQDKSVDGLNQKNPTLEAKNWEYAKKVQSNERSIADKVQENFRLNKQKFEEESLIEDSGHTRTKSNDQTMWEMTSDRGYVNRFHTADNNATQFNSNSSDINVILTDSKSKVNDDVLHKGNKNRLDDFKFDDDLRFEDDEPQSSLTHGNNTYQDTQKSDTRNIDSTQVKSSTIQKNVPIPITIQTPEVDDESDEATTPTLANVHQQDEWQKPYNEMLLDQSYVPDFKDDDDDDDDFASIRDSKYSSEDESGTIHALNSQQKAQAQLLQTNLNQDSNRESMMSVMSGAENWYDPDEWALESARQSMLPQSSHEGLETYGAQQNLEYQPQHVKDGMGYQEHKLRGDSDEQIQPQIFVEQDYDQQSYNQNGYTQNYHQEESSNKKIYRSVDSDDDQSYSPNATYHDQQNPEDYYNRSLPKQPQQTTEDYYHTTLPSQPQTNAENYNNRSLPQHRTSGSSSLSANSSDYSFKHSNSTDITRLEDDDDDIYYKQNDIPQIRQIPAQPDDDDYYSTALHHAPSRSSDEEDYYTTGLHQDPKMLTQGYQPDHDFYRSPDEEEGEITVFMDPRRYPEPKQNQLLLRPYAAAQSSQSFLSINENDDTHSLIRIPSKTNTVYDIGRQNELEEMPHDPEVPRIEDISHYLKVLPSCKANSMGVSEFDTSNDQHVMVKRPISTREMNATQEVSEDVYRGVIPHAHEINLEDRLTDDDSSQEAGHIPISTMDATGYGKMYIGVSGAHHVLLPLPKEITYVRCVISDGEYEYMSRYEILTEQILMDYECVIDTKPGMVITVSLNVRPDYHVRPKTGWSKWFTSVKKQKEHLSGYVFPEDGAIGQTRFVVDHMAPGCYKKTYQAYFDCFNSWYARSNQERARKEKFGEDADFLKIVGKLNIEMLYLPVTNPTMKVPKSLRECDLTLKICQWHETCWQKGYLSIRKQGTKVWKRHYYRLIGSELIAYKNEEYAREGQMYSHFNIADVIKLSTTNDKINSRIEEEYETKEKGFFRLSFIDHYLDCVSDNIKESEGWVKTLKSMIGHVQRFQPILDGIKNNF